ncbi:adenosine receptor A2a-like [Apostichopus japonicus]
MENSISSNGTDYIHSDRTPGINRPFGNFTLRVSTLGLVIYVGVYTLVILFSVLGNSMVINAFIRAKSFCRVHSYFIAGLAVADFLTGLIAIPCAMFARIVVSPLTCYEETRDYFFAPAVIFCSVSVFHLIAIAINRYIAISKPLKYSTIMNPCNCKVIIVAMWCVGIAFGLLPILSKEETVQKSWVCDTDRYRSSAVIAHRIVTSLIIPTFMLFLSLIYVRIFYLAYKCKWDATKTYTIASRPSVAQVHRKSRSTWHIKTTVTSAIILAVFAVCWLPHSFEFLFEVFTRSKDNSLFVFIVITETLGFSNSFANPIIYGFRNRAFRNACREFIDGFRFNRS